MQTPKPRAVRRTGLRPSRDPLNASAEGARSEAKPNEAGWTGLRPGRDHKTTAATSP